MFRGGEICQFNISDDYFAQIEVLPKDQKLQNPLKHLFYQHALQALLTLRPYQCDLQEFKSAFPTRSQTTGIPLLQYSASIKSLNKYDFIKVDDNTFTVVITPYTDFELALTQLDDNRLQVNIIMDEAEGAGYQFYMPGTFTFEELKTKAISDVIVQNLLMEALNTTAHTHTLNKSLELPPL